MDIQAYSAAVERQFQKSEYISIKHTSVKMFTSPKFFKGENCRLFAFVVNGTAPSADLTQKLCDYALSVAFYDDPQKKSKIIVLPLFICEEFSGDALALVNTKAKKIGGAFCLTSIFNAQSSQLKIQKLPIMSSSFIKEISLFVKKTFELKNEVNLTEEI